MSKYVFKSTVDSYFYYEKELSKEYDIEIIDNKITINWDLIISTNNQGITDVSFDIDKLEGFFYFNLYEKGSDDIFNENVEKNINDIDWGFYVDDFEIKKSGNLFVKGLEFNFKDKICTVMF